MLSHGDLLPLTPTNGRGLHNYVNIFRVRLHWKDTEDGRGSAAKEMREIQVESSSLEATTSTRAAFCRHVSWMMNLGHVR